MSAETRFAACWHSLEDVYGTNGVQNFICDVVSQNRKIFTAQYVVVSRTVGTCFNHVRPLVLSTLAHLDMVPHSASVRLQENRGVKRRTVSSATHGTRCLGTFKDPLAEALCNHDDMTVFSKATIRVRPLAFSQRSL